jgi:hypothetical protein
MRVAAVLFCFAALTIAAAAQDAVPDIPKTEPASDSVEALFHRFDLFGTWAADCQQPASPANPHVGISNPSPGLVLENHDLGSGYSGNRYSVLSAQALSPTRLAVEVIFQPGREGEERQKLIFRIRANTRRTLFNQPDGGAVRVKDGIALARRAKTPVLRKCG